MDSSASVKSVACVGSGGLASSLLPALHGAGYRVVQVCARSVESAQRLAASVGAAACGSLGELSPRADVYVLAVPDGEVESVLRSASFGGGLVVHTSGATPIGVFEKYGVGRCGVLYPLQTFTRGRAVSLAQVPLLVEGSSAEVTEALLQVARSLSENVLQVSSEKRLLLHVAAVFACNFPNHLLAVAAQLARAAGAEPGWLKPLVRETFEKALSVGNPAEVQTGPAIRSDAGTLQRHLAALEKYPRWQQIYKLISESIKLVNSK